MIVVNANYKATLVKVSSLDHIEKTYSTYGYENIEKVLKSVY